MIYIDRSNSAPPRDWLDRADAVTQQLLNEKDPNLRNNIIDDNENLWSEIKDFLLEISDGKCWYSEAIDTYNHLHVDHFRPKKVALGIDKVDYGGYWWLAFDWLNYRVCGGAGNVRKKDKFAVYANKVNQPNSPIDDEIVYFLDPTEEEDVLKITFNSNGEVTPISKDGWDFERADYTITSLNLNFRNLKEARKTLWVKCSRLIKETQDLITQNNDTPSANRRGQIKEKIKQIKELVQKNAPYSATAKSCLNSSGLDWTLKIAA